MDLCGVGFLPGFLTHTWGSFYNKEYITGGHFRINYIGGGLCISIHCIYIHRSYIVVCFNLSLTQNVNKILYIYIVKTSGGYL